MLLQIKNNPENIGYQPYFEPVPLHGRNFMPAEIGQKAIPNRLIN